LIQRVVEEGPPGFASMGLSASMLEALKRVRYLTASPVQSAVIPEALDGYDVIAQAKTGTGKTAAFGIPLIEMLDVRGRNPQAIVLAPTRELVQQIVGELQKLAYGQDATVCGIYGGEPIEKQLRALERGVDIVIGTPGRVIDHIERRTLDLGDIFHVVLDEADRMLDIGFRPDIERILRRVPDPHQTLLLSATINIDVRRLARKYMYQPIEMNLSTDEPSVESIQQFYITVDHERKFDLLVQLLKHETPRQCLVFTRTKRGADKLAERLSHRVPGVAAIHGDLAQTVRNRVMRGFRDGTIPILIATDVVGRGIDVEGISHVINFDVPDDAENYLHRIGRTGRMGKDGMAFMFVTPDQGEPLTAIETIINKTIPSFTIEGFDSHRRAEKRPVFRELFSTTGSRASWNV
jgi:ATP-dependent RNA helicase DeaD